MLLLSRPVENCHLLFVEKRLPPKNVVVDCSLLKVDTFRNKMLLLLLLIVVEKSYNNNVVNPVEIVVDCCCC